MNMLYIELILRDVHLDKGVVGKAIKGGICSSELSDAVVMVI